MNRASKQRGWRYGGLAVALIAVCGGVAWAADTPGAIGDRPVVRVASERAVGGITAEEYFGRQQQLHARLVAQMPDGVQEAGVRVQLTPEEHGSIEKRIGSGPGPLRIGVTKAVTPAVGLARGVRTIGEDGSFVWAMTITSEGAGGIRAHLQNVSLPDGAELFFFSAEGEAYGPFTGRGPNGDGEFWTPSVFSDTGVLMLTAPQEIKGAPFVVTEVGHIGPDFPGAVEQLGEGLCGNADCIIDATCFNVSAVADAKDAVAKMEWVKRPWLYTCTGGLIADTDPSSEIPYFLTANHCISADKVASNLELFWFYRTANCGDSCPDDSNFPKTIGATVKATNSVGDFTLLELSQTPPSGTVFLGWNNAEIAYTNGADLYRISHPNFGAQVYSHHQVDANAATCSSWPRGERIYSNDVEGATDGGSSGSPVVNAASEVVGQLSGCCGYNCGDVCDSASNSTVDGALAHYWAEVEPFLDPGGGCTTNADCDDGDACNGAETCVDTVCQPGTPVNCDDGDACTTDSCDPATGACSNDPISCDDGDVCTADSCDPATGCVNAWAACDLNTSDGCCGPDCDSTNDVDCESCVEAGGYCTSGADCCSGSCHPRKNYCR